jgi:hypothetical protein
MRQFKGYLLLSVAVLCMVACADRKSVQTHSTASDSLQPYYQDKPFEQEFSIRYLADNTQQASMLAVSANRDGQIRLLTNHGVMVPDNGSIFFDGGLTPDVAYPQLTAKKIKAITTYHNQTVYLDDRQIFSNAWAGKYQVSHGLENARLLAGGDDFHFLISDGEKVLYLDRTSKILWTGTFSGLKQISYLTERKCFLLVSDDKVGEYLPGQPIKEIYTGKGITCASGMAGNRTIIGTSTGYLILPGKEMVTKLPCTDITAIREIDGQLWFGSGCGAFRMNEGGQYSYYAGGRWLPDNHVLALEAGPENSILVLTQKGIGKICRRMMTLEEKAMFYEKQVREKNIRYGFNCSSSRLVNNFSSGLTSAQPSDNLWTSMYLASQLYRYKVTGSEEALQNAYESFEAMERLFTVTGRPGLFARSFERDYKVDTVRKPGWEKRELLSGSPASLWLPAADHANWTWRSTASSDQTVGQLFALTTILELADDKEWKERALKCLDDLVGYIVKNDFYLIDIDGQPTLWGKWNPAYVNNFAKNVNDRKLYSSNIIAFLQAAWHFTEKPVYKEKAYELMEKHGYLENLTRPFSEIGQSDADTLSRILTSKWNHSDDEMYFLAYQELYKYAFSPELKVKYKSAIQDHWNIERPEGNGLWNLIYASTGAKEFDLDRSVRFLQSYPLDMRNWAVTNSNRKDLELLPANFRSQTTRELLPLSELPLYRHNGEIFTLDSGGDGTSLISAGDVWLLPYWMGRYLGVIKSGQ